jgi:DNA-binding transcriptional regulator YdaS (Cro superfamily)
MNELRPFLNAMPTGEQVAFARRCGTTIGYLRKALSTGAALGERLCVSIERESSGAVTRRDLRPDDWREIWPELATPTPPAAASAAQGETHA